LTLTISVYRVNFTTSAAHSSLIIYSVLHMNIVIIVKCHRLQQSAAQSSLLYCVT